MQTGAALAKNFQHCWMPCMFVASVCTPCCVLLEVVAQTLKPVKPLSLQPSTFLLFTDRRSLAQQCWVRLHSSFHHAGTTQAYYTWSPLNCYGLYPPTMDCGFQFNIVRSCCIRLHTTVNTDATTPNIVSPAMLGASASVST